MPRIHGLYGTPEHQAFYKAKSRCNRKKDKRYADYGGRGILFLFSSVAQWFAELGPRPSTHHTVDRINNDGHYEPGNVRWATAHEQRVNQRKRTSHSCENCGFMMKCPQCLPDPEYGLSGC